MIINIEEAHDLCVRNGVKIANHKVVIVTSDGHIYLNEINIPGSFILKGEIIQEEIKDKKPKKVDTKDNGESNDNI